PMSEGLPLRNRSRSNSHLLVMSPDPNVAFEFDAASHATLRLQLRSRSIATDTAGLRATLMIGSAGQQIWSQHRVIERSTQGSRHHPTIVQLGAELADALGEYLASPKRAQTAPADASCLAGIRHLFAFTPHDVAEAESLFRKAQSVESRGLYWAWLAQVRTIQRVEMYDNDLQGLRAEGEYYSARALELEPNNSMVLALCSNAEHILRMDARRGLELADRAVHINPYNPMAWWALSSSKLYAREVEQSYREALRGRYLTAKSPIRFWWDLQVFAAAMMTGRLDEAVECLKGCAAQNPNFRPPLRYLLALLAGLGDEFEAQRIIQCLLRLEPGFTVQQLLEDRQYPASLLHRAPGVDLKRVQSTSK
ncbi:tetratricopeptide repeat protein, partial [Roseobacter sinensis]